MKVTLHSQMSDHLSVINQNPKKHPSSFILNHSSFIILHSSFTHFSSYFLHFATFKLFSLFLFAGDSFSNNSPLDRLRRNCLHDALVPRNRQRAAGGLVLLNIFVCNVKYFSPGWNMNPEDKNIRECKPVYFLF